VARRQPRLDSPLANPDSTAHRRQIALRANAGLSKDGGNSMQVPLVLDQVHIAEIAGPPPSTSPYYPPLWTGGAVFVIETGRIAYSNGTVWVDMQGHTAFLDGWAVLDPANFWTTIKKIATETVTNSAALQDDDVLKFPVAASKSYSWRGALFYNTTAAQNFKYTFTGPSGLPSPFGVRFGHSANLAASAMASAFGSALALVVSATDNIVMFSGAMVNGANAGNVQLQWAQNTAGVGITTSVYRGSYIEWIET